MFPPYDSDTILCLRNWWKKRAQNVALERIFVSGECGTLERSVF